MTTNLIMADTKLHIIVRFKLRIKEKSCSRVDNCSYDATR